MERNLLFDQPEHGRSLKERRFSMIETIKRHETVLQDVRKRIESIPNNANLARINAELDDIWLQVKNNVSPESFAEWETSEDLSSETDFLIRQNAVLQEQLADTADNAQYLELTDRLSDIEERLFALESELDPLLKKPDIILLDNIHSILENLRAKAPLVARLKRSPKKALRALNDRIDPQTEPAGYEPTFKRSDISSVEYGPFEITFILSGEAFERYNKLRGNSSQGVHYKRSPFSLVDASGPDPKATKQHESVHNLLDGRFFGLEDYMLNALSYYERSQQPGHEPYHEHEKRRLFKLSPTDCLDNLKEEILAELEIAEKSDFGLMPEQEISLNPAEQGFVAAESFATAGQTVRDFVAKAEQIALDELDPDVRDFLDSFSVRLQTRFLEIAENLNTAFAVAQRLPESVRAHDALINLCLMLRPSQYTHLPKLLQEMFDKKDCQEAEESVRFARLVGKDIKKGLTAADIPKKLFPQDQQTVGRCIRSLAPYEIANMLVGDDGEVEISEMRLILKRFTEIEKLIGRTPETTDIKNRIPYKFFYNLAQNSIYENFKPLTQIFPELTAAEQASWIMAVRSYFDINFLGQDLRQNMSVRLIEEWREKLDWTLFYTLGLSHQLQTAIDETVAEEKEWLAIRKAAGQEKIGGLPPEQPFSSI